MPSKLQSSGKTLKNATREQLWLKVLGGEMSQINNMKNGIIEEFFIDGRQVFVKCSHCGKITNKAKELDEATFLKTLKDDVEEQMKELKEKLKRVEELTKKNYNDKIKALEDKKAKK